MASNGKEIVKEVPNILRVYNDGTVERLVETPLVPPSPDPNPETGVSSTDVTISDDPPLSARIYLPKLEHPTQKIPVLVYFHGGGFCFESAFSFLETRYLNRLVPAANVLAVSIEYRLAPEHPLPIGYEDCWAGLRWVTSHSVPGPDKDPWISQHGDLSRVFVGGDSAGANLAHNVVMRAGMEDLPGGIKISGCFMTNPYFWSSEPMGSSSSEEEHRRKVPSLVWEVVYPGAEGGLDNEAVNPTVKKLAAMGCRRVLVLVAGDDEFDLRERAVIHVEKVRRSEWKGEVELVEFEGEKHAFQISAPERENAGRLINTVVHFLQKGCKLILSLEPP